MIKAIIMAGGEGTRLRPLTCNRAKPMIPVANKPVIEHAIDLLKKHGITDIIISLFYLPENIQNYFGDGSEWDVNITYSVEENPLGTAGGVKKAIGNHDDTFLILSGDGIVDFDLSKILKFHKEKNSPFTIVLKRVKEPTEYGIVITEESGKITKFLEKPSWSEVFTDTANTGMYVIEPTIIKEFVPKATKYDFSFDLFPKLQENNIPLFGYISDGYWCDVGNIESFKSVHYDILDDLVNIELPGKMIQHDVWVGRNVEIHPDAIINGPAIIGDFVRIKEKAEISDFTVIGSNCVIEAGASLRRTIILASTVIGPKSELRGSIIGKRCVLEEGVSVYEGAVISDDCQIGSNTEIPSGLRVWPDKIIEKGTKLTYDLIWGQTEKRHLFTAEGITGSFNVKMTPEFAAKLGSAIGAYLGKNSRITISRDSKGSSRLIKRALTSGLLSMGVEVFDMEIESIPVSRYSARFVKADMGIHVQRTNNTGMEFILIRLFDRYGFALPLSAEKKIESIFFRGDYPRKSAYEVGQLHYPTHHIESYIDNTFNYIDRDILLKKSWDVMIDCSYGSASYVFSELLSYYGCNTTIMRGQVKYGDKKTNDKKDTKKAITALKNMCKMNKEPGVMIGPNGEDIVIIDETGKTISTSDITSLMCMYYLKHKDTKIVNIPVTGTRNLETIANNYTGNISRISTKARSPENSSDIFIENEHGIYPHLELDYDPMISFLLILELATLENKKLHDLKKIIPSSNISKVSIPCSQDDKASIMRFLTEISGDEEIEFKDGIRIVRDDSWILILPDAAQPIIHLYAEGNTLDERDDIIKEFSVKIKSFKGTTV